MNAQKGLLIGSIMGGGVIDTAAWLALADCVQEYDPSQSNSLGDDLGHPSADLLRMCVHVCDHLFRPLGDVLGDHACSAWRQRPRGYDLPWFWTPGRPGSRNDPRDGEWGWPGWHCCGRNGLGRIPGILAAMRWISQTLAPPPDFVKQGCADWLGTSLLYAVGMLSPRQKEARFHQIRETWPDQSLPRDVKLTTYQINRMGGLFQLFGAIKRLGGGPSGVCVPVMTGIEGDERTDWMRSNGWAFRGRASDSLRGMQVRARHRSLVRMLWHVNVEKVYDRLLRARAGRPWSNLGSRDAYVAFLRGARP